MWRDRRRSLTASLNHMRSARVRRDQIYRLYRTKKRRRVGELDAAAHIRAWPSLGEQISTGQRDWPLRRLRRPCWRDRRRLRWSSDCPASLTTVPVERVVVVMKDGAAREAPLAAVLFDQLGDVAAGRKATVVAASLDAAMLLLVSQAMAASNQAAHAAVIVPTRLRRWRRGVRALRTRWFPLTHT